MTIKSIKTTGLSFAFAAVFLAAASASSASAQVPQRFDNGRQVSHGFDHGRRMNNRREQIEERKGFSAGLARGKADALARRKFNPFILQRRFVSNDYREGFRKGYAQAYARFAKNRGRHNVRGF
jgi:hypothetical protein